MSHVTNVIVTLDPLDHNFVIKRINTWLRLARHRNFVRVDEYSIGKKGFEARVYLCDFNYLDINRFIKFCKLLEEKRGYRHHIHFSLVIVDPEGIHHFLEIGEPL